MLLFPCLYILHGDSIVWVPGHLLVNVNYHQWHDHFLHVNLIQRAEALDKVCWRVHMSSPLTDMRIILRVEAGPEGARTRRAIIVPEQKFSFLIRKTRPMRNDRFKGVCQIDEFFFLDDVPGTCESGLLGSPTHKE